MTEQYEKAVPSRTMRLAGSLGHVEISWDSKDDEAIRAMIEAKHAAGIRFFLIKTSGLFRTSKLTAIEQLKRRRINVHDADIEKLAADGAITLTPLDDSHQEYSVVPGVPTVEQLVEGNSVAIPRPKGG